MVGGPAREHGGAIPESDRINMFRFSRNFFIEAIRQIQMRFDISDPFFYYVGVNSPGKTMSGELNDSLT